MYVRLFSVLWIALALALPLAVAAPLAGQGPDPTAPRSRAASRAAPTITEADVRRRIDALAADSMRGRNTPSPELDQAAAYIATEFRRIGLQPGGDSGTFVQRYPIRIEELDPASRVTFDGPAPRALTVGYDIVLVLGNTGDVPLTAPVVLMWGLPTDSARPFGDVDLQGAVVVHALPMSAFNAGALLAFGPGAAAGARAWIFAADLSPEILAQVRTQYGGVRARRVGAAEHDVFALPLFGTITENVRALFDAAGVDSATVADSVGIRALPGASVNLAVRYRPVREASAPNVVGILPGSDPVLRNEYVVFSAHMDHVGVAEPVDGDSVFNGADDNASGTVTVVELAEALAMLQPRPRRSMIFLAVSGEEKGLWGSAHFTEHPPVPIADMVADLNADMVGRNWPDTIAVIGREHSDLGTTLDQMAAAHPETGMTPVGDLWPEEGLYQRSDHYNFARLGVPVLFFTSGLHPQYHTPADSPDLIDAEKTARIGQLLFWLGLELANRDARPAWNPESRRQIVEEAAKP